MAREGSNTEVPPDIGYMSSLSDMIPSVFTQTGIVAYLREVDPGFPWRVSAERVNRVYLHGASQW